MVLWQGQAGEPTAAAETKLELAPSPLDKVLRRTFVLASSFDHVLAPGLYLDTERSMCVHREGG